MSYLPVVPSVVAVINQEKTIQHIEGFDKTKLRHAETAEKNPLPDKEGESNRGGNEELTF